MTLRDAEICELVKKSLLIKPQDNELNLMILSGPAGTGKSTFIRSLAHEAITMHKKVAIICPTNKSICNLATDEELANVSHTYASFFKCRFDILDEEQGLQCYIKCCETQHSRSINHILNCLRKNKPAIGNRYDLVIVEEASMFHHQFFNLLKFYKDITSILFVGDSNQIPSINNDCKDCLGCNFSVFRSNIPMVAFKEQKRHCNELYIQLQTFLRKISECPSLSSRKIKTITAAIFEKKSLNDILPLKAPIISYHVNTANQINNLLSGNRTAIQEGDVVTIDVGSIELLPVGSVVKIKSIKKEFFMCFKLERGFNFDVYEVVCGNTTHVINCIDPIEREEYITHCRNLRAQKTAGNQFKMNVLIKEHLTKFSLAYSITAHKAQGQTYDSTYVCYEDITSCKDMDMTIMVLYSAISRARNKVTLVTIPDHFRVPKTSVVDEAFWCSVK